ncbi:MAG: hypothetical protein V2I34_07705 [Bacteroidales bacterium]|jgi:hypothetical protein|nr:hypothetical protein [Bacteroidales bacterium]
MKKSLIITLIILVIILILPAVGFFGWFFKEKKPLNIVILDKTVHSLDRVKHRALNWVLANERFVKENNRKYSLRKDYYGFFPMRPLRAKQFDRNDYRLAEVINIADSCDALYYADTYGVFFNDWYPGINRSRHSRKLYGGLNNNDYLLLSEMKRRNKLTILEYNSFDYPTDAYERYRVEELLGFKSTGWSGQYYPSLDSTSAGLPSWIVELYKKRTREPWPFRNAGIVLLKGENEILVLEEGTHLENALPFIMSEGQVAADYNLAVQVAFDKAFDIIDPLENKVLSSYKLMTTDEGKLLLDKHFLSDEFPAVIVNQGDVESVYFCGDFATSNLPPWTACLGSLNVLKGLLYKSDDVNDPRRFFWKYYRPLLAGMLNDYYMRLELE